MFPLTPNECVFFDTLYRYFPDAREVTGAEKEPGGTLVPPQARPGWTPAAPVTSQVSLWNQEAA